MTTESYNLGSYVQFAATRVATSTQASVVQKVGSAIHRWTTEARSLFRLALSSASLVPGNAKTRENKFVQTAGLDKMKEILTND